MIEALLIRTEPDSDKDKRMWEDRVRQLVELLAKNGCIQRSDDRPYGLGLRQDAGGWFKIDAVLGCPAALGWIPNPDRNKATAELLSLVAWFGARTPIHIERIIEISIEKCFGGTQRFPFGIRVVQGMQKSPPRLSGSSL